MGFQKTWEAFIPGARYAALGESVGMPEEGAYSSILDILMLALSAAVNIVEGQAGLIINLALLIVIVLFYIYRIRFGLRLIEAFGLKTRWIILWIAAESLTMLIIGFGKRYQVRKDFDPEEEWKAGTKPAEIAGTATGQGGASDGNSAPGVSEHGEGQAEAVPAGHEGLQIDLKERTIRDHGKKRYLLKDIHLAIPNKSLVMLLGGSGAGKTVFLNAMIGYEKADAKVYLNGSDVYENYDSVKYRIGFVPQQNLIRGKDTVVRTVKDAAALRLPKALSRKETGERVNSVMDLLGLTAGKAGLVSKKSGGMLRRISIAMELVSDPELFVLDEPDSGLDGAITKEIFRKLRDIADEGRIVIVITHTPDRVVDLFDKVIVLARDSGRVGRLAFYGSPAEAKEFFEKETMEDIVVRVNSKEAGGEGLADEYIERYAAWAASKKGGTAS